MKAALCGFLLGLFAVCLTGLVTVAAQGQSAPLVERWSIFEVSLKGPSAGNPFQDVSLTASLAQGDQTVEVGGFYDGDGTYRIRFMPEKTDRKSVV